MWKKIHFICNERWLQHLMLTCSCLLIQLSWHQLEEELYQHTKSGPCGFHIELYFNVTVQDRWIILCYNLHFLVYVYIWIFFIFSFAINATILCCLFDLDMFIVGNMNCFCFFQKAQGFWTERVDIQFKET